MTATINASTGAGGGIVHTSDASGALALQTAGVTALSIDASQNVSLTNPLPVASGGSGASTSTGTGANVLATSPTLVTPNLGTPSAVVLTNATGTANSLNAGIGVNQTWTDFTASGRVAGTTYTNSTGKPIQLLITIAVSTQSFYLSINGTVVARVGNNAYIDYAPFSAIIPNGATYKVDGGVSLWWELR